ncbi:hypothetical protein TrVE_jg10909 [Triparma verrucosa]|uniref:Uncharacterized protein n=1 Tax=Triparma verrucosa TaxID=1606542 RepID=A0A9W7KWJ3_9STRA|nr:hypothetical protein TrVE_jg10909 [Triparma verrucosa]
MRILLLLLSAATILVLPSPTTSLAFHKISKRHSAVATRRDLLGMLALSGFAARGLADDAEAEAKAKEKARNEAMKARIAASKQNYRKADTLLDQRKGVDYSCVAKTGSPCPSGEKDKREQSPASSTFEDL